MKIKITLLSIFALCLGFTFQLFAGEIVYGDGKNFQGKYGELYYETEGEGTPVVVINGGPGGNHSIFLGWFDFVAKNGFKMVYFDETGRGRATRKIEGKPITPQMGVDDLESLRKELNVEKLIIIAHSYGGIQGMQYAIQYPQHVEKLLMLNASYDAKSHEMNIEHVKDYTRINYPKRWEKLLELRKKGVKSTEDVYTDLLSVGSEMYWKEPENRKLLRKVRTGDKRDRGNIQVYFDIIGDDPEWQVNGTLSGLEVEPQLKQFKIPTLILGGRHDKITTPEIVHRLYRMMPEDKTTLVMFEDSGHWPWVEENKKFQDTILSFIGK